MEEITQEIVIRKADLQSVLSRLKRLETEIQEIKTERTIDYRIDALQKNGFLSAAAICRLVGWSYRTFHRRVRAGAIPVTLEGGTRYKMSVDEFKKWYKENFITE